MAKIVAPPASLTLAVKTYLSMAYAKFHLVVVLITLSKDIWIIGYFNLYIIELKKENEEIKKLVKSNKRGIK